MKTRLIVLAFGIAMLVPRMTQAQSRFDELANPPFDAKGWLD